MMTVIVTVAIVCATVLAVALMVFLGNRGAREAADRADMWQYMAARDKVREEEAEQARAMELYSLQATLQTIQAQAAAQAQAQTQTAYALTKAIETIQSDRKTAEALEAMRWRALEKMYLPLLTEKREKEGYQGRRYWEGVGL